MQAHAFSIFSFCEASIFDCLYLDDSSVHRGWLASSSSFFNAGLAFYVVPFLIFFRGFSVHDLTDFSANAYFGCTALTKA